MSPMKSQGSLQEGGKRVGIKDGIRGHELRNAGGF